MNIRLHSTLPGRLGKRIPAPGHCLLCHLGQHSFIVKLGTVVIYLDPFLTRLPGRLVPPLFRPEDATNAAIVTGSHDHGDHIDRPAWPAIAAAAPEAVFVVPEAVRPTIAEVPSKRLRGLNAGESFSHAGVTITAVPAAHEFLDRDEKTGLYPYLGYIIQGNGVTIYHSGDTCLYEGMASLLRQWTIDVAILPINGRDAARLRRNCIGNMTYQEAADLAGAIKPRVTIPAHFDMFRGNTADPREFLAYMAVKYPNLKTLRPRLGDVNEI